MQALEVCADQTNFNDLLGEPYLLFRERLRELFLFEPIEIRSWMPLAPSSFMQLIYTMVSMLMHTSSYKINLHGASTLDAKV